MHAHRSRFRRPALDSAVAALEQRVAPLLAPEPVVLLVMLFAWRRRTTSR
nr:hypothetical protein [Microbacterium barkeri]